MNDLIFNILFYVLTTIGIATIVFRVLLYISEKTKTEWDNRLVAKLKIKEILDFLVVITETISLNKSTKKVIIDIKEKK